MRHVVDIPFEPKCQPYIVDSIFRSLTSAISQDITTVQNNEKNEIELLSLCSLLSLGFIHSHSDSEDALT